MRLWSIIPKETIQKSVAVVTTVWCVNWYNWWLASTGKYVESHGLCVHRNYWLPECMMKFLQLSVETVQCSYSVTQSNYGTAAITNEHNYEFKYCTAYGFGGL